MSTRTPHPDTQTAEVLAAAVADLAARHGARLSDPLATIEILTALIGHAQGLRAELVTDARAQARTWHDIADALGVSAEHARTHHHRKGPRTA